jgi:hypothetical protein
MKKLLLFCVAAGISVVASAQRVYFLYLQSDDHSPFYVRMGDKIHSSASSGYLIIPNLADSTYTFGLGFAKNNNPETRFTVTINQDDKGYIIKNFETGLSLFDFRDLSIVKSNTVQTDNTVYETKSDNFSSVLSKAANDPSLLRVPVVKKETSSDDKPVEKEVVTAKIEEVQPVEKEKPVQATTESQPQVPAQPEVAKASEKKPATELVDTASKLQKETETVGLDPTTETKPVPKTESNSEPVITEQVASYKRSVVSRYSESSTTEGFGIVYFDKTTDYTDTIRILIPASKTKIDDGAQTVSLSEIEKKDNSTPKEARQTDVQFLQETPAEKSKTGQNTASAIEAPSVVANTSSCKENASDKDFVKLRKKMVGEETDEAMIDEAKKVFRNKCFTVEQLRYLSTLFLTSAAKYQFFDASYNHASDKQNFATLKSEIKDEYYLNRFKALVGE